MVKLFCLAPPFAASTYAESVGHIAGEVIGVGIVLGFEVCWIVSVIRGFRRGTLWSIILSCIGACALLAQLIAVAMYLITGTAFPVKPSSRVHPPPAPISSPGGGGR